MYHVPSSSQQETCWLSLKKKQETRLGLLWMLFPLPKLNFVGQCSMHVVMEEAFHEADDKIIQRELSNRSLALAKTPRPQPISFFYES